jgi:hypothetical protein
LFQTSRCPGGVAVLQHLYCEIKKAIAESERSPIHFTERFSPRVVGKTAGPTL